MLSTPSNLPPARKLVLLLALWRFAQAEEMSERFQGSVELEVEELARDISGVIARPDGEIWVVNPRRDEVAGHRCYRSVAELPASPDAAHVGVNRNLTIDIVRDLAAREGCTLFMVLLAAFKVLVARHTGIEDIVIGTPIAGRRRTELEGLIEVAPDAEDELWPEAHGE